MFGSMTRLQWIRTPDGRRLEASHVVAAPAEDAWETLIDTRRWPEWLPGVSGVDASHRHIREGTTGRIRLPGVWTPFTITEVDDRQWSWSVAGVPGATHRVDDLTADRCRIAFELPTQAFATTGAALYALERLEELLVPGERRSTEQL